MTYTNGLTAFAVHFYDADGAATFQSVIEATDYFAACTIALGADAADFKVFEGTPQEVEDIAGVSIQLEVRELFGEEEYRRHLYT